MDRLSITSRNAIHNVAAHLPVLAALKSHTHKMRAEEISAFRILLKSQHPVRPLAHFEIVCGIESMNEPVCATVQAQYVEKTWSGYYIDAAIIKLRPQDRARWERCVARTAALAPEAGQSTQTALSGWHMWPQLVTVGSSLPNAVRNELRQLGLQVHCADSTKRALALLPRRPDILIVDTSLPSVDVPSLCEQVSGREGAPDLMLIAEHASEVELASLLAAGATRIVLKPCNQHMLIHRIKAALVERAELQTAAYSSARTLSPVADPAQSDDEVPTRSADAREGGFWSSLAWQLRGFIPQALRGSAL